MGKPIVVLGQHEIDKIKSMPRKELNAECLHLMREQMELTQQLHDMQMRLAVFERFWYAYKKRTSMPVAFPHTQADKHWAWADHWESEINAAIQRLRELDKQLPRANEQSQPSLNHQASQP